MGLLCVLGIKLKVRVQFDCGSLELEELIDHDMSHAIALPFKLANLICDESAIKTHMEIKGFELIASTTSLFSYKNPQNEVSTMSVSAHEDFKEGANVLKFVIQNGNTAISSNTINQESDCSQSEVSCSLEVNSVANKLATTDDKKSFGDPQTTDKSCFLESNSKSEIVGDFVVAVNNEVVEIEGTKQRKSTMHLEGIQEKKIISLLDFVPFWGITSLQGRRSEMEDAVVAVPQFLQVPTSMITPVSNGLDPNLSHSTAHFFGVYDGHGGCQVANYCRDRMHLALAEEMKIASERFYRGSEGYNWQEQWEKAFLKCFQKVDAEVGGVNEGTTDAIIASDAVGSTAVVSVICSTHIIIANCGDSRAVLCRGKVSVPLSIDHKPSRVDERERIEAAGGKVIYWDEFRVSGVLAMSRSIGDRYLEPYVIPDPEIMFVPRTKEDKCLILASDGLWDVVTNEEACDVARKRILLWHKKNGPVSSARGEGIDDPAAQDAADYLSRLALQRGSKDNISVIVVDLKAQGILFKKKT